MARTSNFVMDLPSGMDSFAVIARRLGCGTRKLAAVGALVVAVVALPGIAARLAAAAGQLFVALDFETMASQTAQAVTLAFTNNALSCTGGSTVAERVRRGTGLKLRHSK